EQRQVNVEAHDETPSTNDQSKEEASSIGPEPKLYLAAHQTHGRGRGKNTWSDTGAGESLLSSWSFQLAGPAQAITGPPLGDALYRSACAIWPSLEWSLKAPNDLYLGPSKVAGLLVEAVSQGDSHRLIVGLGMNVLNHPRAIANSTHLGLSFGESGLAEGEW